MPPRSIKPRSPIPTWRKSPSSCATRLKRTPPPKPASRPPNARYPQRRRRRISSHLRHAVRPGHFRQCSAGPQIRPLRAGRGQQGSPAGSAFCGKLRSRGVGYYYLPPQFGGGNDLAIKDFQKALELDPQSADAHMWLGLALRKANRNAEARKEFQRALELNPARVWAKQQLEKTPVREPKREVQKKFEMTSRFPSLIDASNEHRTALKKCLTTCINCCWWKIRSPRRTYLRKCCAPGPSGIFSRWSRTAGKRWLTSIVTATFTDSPKPDLIFLDLSMPGLDGFETLRQIRHHEDIDVASIPVIVLTNSVGAIGCEAGLPGRRELLHHQTVHARAILRADGGGRMVLVRDQQAASAVGFAPAEAGSFAIESPLKP